MIEACEKMERHKGIKKEAAASPEMIAASGSAGTLALPIGAAALVVILLAFTVFLVWRLMRRRHAEVHA